MSDKQRVVKVLKFSKLSATKFAKLINVAPSTMSAVVNPDKSVKPGMSIIKGILELYPRINPRWLILGEGEMWQKEGSNCKEIEQKYLEEKEKSSILKKNRELVFKLMSNEYPDIMKEFEEYF